VYRLLLTVALALPIWVVLAAVAGALGLLD
jgi:hypothetical protein